MKTKKFKLRDLLTKIKGGTWRPEWSGPNFRAWAADHGVNSNDADKLHAAAIRSAKVEIVSAPGSPVDWTPVEGSTGTINHFHDTMGNHHVDGIWTINMKLDDPKMNGVKYINIVVLAIDADALEKHRKRPWNERGYEIYAVVTNPDEEISVPGSGGAGAA